MMVNNEWFISNIQKCKEIVGEEQIYSDLRKLDPSRQSKLVAMQRRNPFLFEIYLADKQISGSHGLTLPMSNEIIHLANLGDNLAILQKNFVKGLNGKIRDLFTTKYQSTIYELSAAAVFLKNNINVEFILESTNKRPDILVHLNEGVEVECKKKDQLTPRDRQNDTFWIQYSKNTIQLMNSEKKNLVVVLETEKDPKNCELNQILEKTGEQIKSIRESKVVFTDKNFKITLMPTEPYDEILPTSFFNISEYYRKCGFYDNLTDLDWEHNGTYIMKLEDGSMQQKNPQLVGCKSKMMPDRITSIIKSIEKAKQQLSGDKPGLIFVDHNVSTRNRAETDLTRITPMIEKILLNNPKISGIVLTQIQIFHEPMGTTYYHKAHLFGNPNPRNPLPSDIKIMMNSF